LPVFAPQAKAATAGSITGTGGMAPGDMRVNERGSADWTALRDRWEWSHILRAVLGLSSFILLASTVAV
jgi:hypothetical protein